MIAPRARALVRRWRVAALAVLLFAGLAGSHAAQAQPPPQLTIDIERILGAHERVLAGAAGRVDDEQTQAALRAAEAFVSSAVIAAIAEVPGQAGSIVAYAARAAPALAPAVVADARAAFPGFDDLIRDAAARPEAYLAPASRATAAPVAASWDEAAGERLATVRPAAGEDAAPNDGDAADWDEDALEDDDDFGRYDDLDETDIDALYDAPALEVDDPLEDVNRAVFWFNMEVLDAYVLRPVAWAYGQVMPEFAKEPVRRAFRNLNEPVVLANDLLQGELEDAGVALARFAINSTLGLAGLFDPAAEIGLPPHKADFGQTLHSWGLGSGPYLVLPLFGPSNLRDTGGLIVDTFLDPWPYVIDDRAITLGLTAGEGIALREDALETLDALEESSVDFYAALRSAYTQNRAAELERDD